MIQELAGHVDLKTTMRYMHMVEGEKTRAIQALTEYQSQVHVGSSLGSDVTSTRPTPAQTAK